MIERMNSHDALSVVLKFHNERLYILALFLPLLNAALSVWIEVLFLLIEERLCLKARYVVELKLFLSFCPFDVGLFGKKLNQLELSLFFFESLLLLRLLELLISHFPEFGEFFRFFVFGFTLLLSALDL